MTVSSLVQRIHYLFFVMPILLQSVWQLYSPPAVQPAALQPTVGVGDLPADAKFKLNPLGVAGFFGGDIAISGMATAVFCWRGWGGLYNTSGSLQIARYCGQLANKRIYRRLFPGDTRDSSRLFGLDGEPGPKLFSTHSGLLFDKIGHVGYLVARLARNERPEVLVRELTQRQKQRITVPATVTVIDLTHLDGSKPDATICPTPPHQSCRFFALFPTTISLLACIVCAWIGDWWTFSSILWGMLANGCACFVLGRGTVTFQHPKLAHDSRPDHSILWATRTSVIVIRGSKRAVNTITHNRFFSQYDTSRRTSGAHSGWHRSTKLERHAAWDQIATRERR